MGQVTQRLNADNGALDRAEVEALLALAAELRDAKKGKQQIRALTTAGHIAHHLANAASQPELIAQGIDLILDDDPGLQQRPSAGSAASGYSVLESAVLKLQPDGVAAHLSRLLVLTHRHGLLLKLLAANPSAGRLVAASLSAIVADEQLAEGRDIVTPEFLNANWGIFEPSALGTAIRECNRTGALDEFIRSKGFSPPDSAFLDRWLEAQPENSRLYEFVTTGLKSMPTAMWLDQLKSGGTAVFLLARCKEMRPDLYMGQGFRDAVCDHGELVGRGEIAGDESISRILLGCIEPSERRFTGRKLWAVVEERRDRTSPAFFAAYGKQLTSSKAATGPGSVVLMHDLYRSRQEGALAWLVSYAEANAAELKREEDFHVLAGDIANELRDGPDDAVHPLVIRLAEALEIAASPPIQPTGDDEKAPEP